MVLTLWTCQLSSLSRDFTGRLIRPDANENRPGGEFPWEAAAGECLFALIWQPLPRPGQPEAATPGSWTRVALAPGAWSCMQRKPPLRRGAIVFSGRIPRPGLDRFRVGPDRFRARGWTDSAQGAGPVPRPGPDWIMGLMAWMPRSCCWSTASVGLLALWPG